jgi:ABC-2 type transport system permease protein
MALVGTIVFFSNRTTADIADKLKTERFSMMVTDDSHLLKPGQIKANDIQLAATKQAGIDAVKNGTVEAYFYFPANVTNSAVEVYGRNVGIFDNDKYSSVAKFLLDQSVSMDVTPNDAAILKGTIQVKSTAYENGQVYDGLQRAIMPGLFLVLFYFLLAMFGGQMLASTTEEKENRVMEMILTTVTARTLIVGKILSLVTLAFVQGIIFATPVVLAYVFFRNQLSIPAIDFSTIPIDPFRIGIAALIFTASFFLFTGLLVMIGAASPTAKEASGFMGVVMMFLFAPLYAATLFISSPGTLIVKILTFFPLTAPIPAMIRNAAGNLSVNEAFLVVVLLTISAIVVMALAIRLFKYGAIEYSKKLSLKTLFKK